MYLICWIFVCYAQLTCVEAATTPSRLTETISTCPYRKVNYITHVLPQQCLTASRTSSIGENVTTTADTETQLIHVLTTSTVEPKPETSDQDDHEEMDGDSRLGGFADSKGDSDASSHLQGQKLTDVPELTDEDSPLESGNFLSFEEWKKQSLQKAGQSEHVGKATKPEIYEGRNRLAQVHNSLDSLGDDGEIDIDFSGFVPDGPQKPIPQNQDTFDTSNNLEADREAPPKIKSRSKDAGTTSKERFNYASFDCAANVLKTNPAAESPLSVLSENKDAYMLNKCSADNKFLILELCNDISIDTIVLANFEFFSSTFRTFRVSVSDRYPAKTDKWKTLGTYEARNSREVQAFLVENPVIWARYLRIEFLTHYGNEFYCPVSLVRVHGTTMLEEYKHDLEAGMNDDADEEEDVSLSEMPDVNIHEPELIAEQIEEAGIATEQVIAAEQGIAISSDDESKLISSLVSVTAPASIFEDMMAAVTTPTTCLPQENPSITAINTLHNDKSTSQSVRITSEYDDQVHSANASSIEASAPTKEKGDQADDLATSKVHSEGVNESKVQSRSKSSSTSSKAPETDKHKSSSQTADRSHNTTATNDRPKVASSVSSAPHTAPTMQESFFKSVQKRLQMLESNSSLSLQYIEDQSRALRDAFKKVEQRQLAKTTSFLEQLNATVLNELREFRQQYDQLWQSTVIELEIQRERYERDNAAINARLGILADEVIFQRRMGILQMILILVCLMLVLFSRGAIHNYLELPLVQNVLSRSPSSRWLNLSGIDSPSRTPQMSRPRSAHQLRTGPGILKGHQRMQSEDSNADTLSPNDVYSPPTPVSFDGLDGTPAAEENTNAGPFESELEDNGLGNPGFDPSSIERPSTSPPAVSNGLLTPVSDDLDAQPTETSIDERLSGLSPPTEYHLAPPRLAVQGCLSAKRLSWNIPDDLGTISDGS